MRTILLVLSGIALIGNSNLLAAKKPGPLIEFKGSFRGTSTLVSGGSTYFGPATMAFSANKAGKVGTLAVNGTVSTGTTSDVSNTFQFTKGTLGIAQLAPPIASTPPPPGSYSASKKVISGTATWPDNNLTMTLTVTIQKKKKTAILTATYVIFSVGVEAYRITYVGTGKIKKK